MTGVSSVTNKILSVDLWGTFDVVNYGDLLFPLILERELRKRLNHLSFAISSPHGNNSPLDPLCSTTRRIVRFEESSFYSQAAGTQALVLAGGDIIRFDDRSLSTIYYRAALDAGEELPPGRFYSLFLDDLARIAHLKPVFWNAVGVPFDFPAQEHERVREALKPVRYLSVRDELSRNRLAATGIKREIAVIPDSCFLLAQLFEKSQRDTTVKQLRASGQLPQRGRTLVIQNVFSQYADAMAIEIRSLLQKYDDLNVVLMPIGVCHNDLTGLKRIHRQLQSARAYVIDKDPSILEIASIISSSDYFVGSSLHGNVTAFVYGVDHAFLCLSQHPPTKLSECAFLMGRQDCVFRTIDGLAQQIEALIDNRHPVDERILPSISGRLNAHFDYLAEELESCRNLDNSSLIKLLDSKHRKFSTLKSLRYGMRSIAPKLKPSALGRRGKKVLKKAMAWGRGRLLLSIETDLSKPLVVGKGNVLSLTGWCAHTVRKIRRIKIRLGQKCYSGFLDSSAAPKESKDQPRSDRGSNNWSKFFVLLPFEPIARDDQVEIVVEATLTSGERCCSEPLTVSLAAEPRRSLLPTLKNDGGGQPLIAICMATFDPRIDLFVTQIESIIGQSHQNWICIINDDCSSKDTYDKILQITGRDQRFVVFRNHARLGFYHNFEACLAHVPKGAEFVAFCDQDDEWYPQKLATLRDGFKDTLTMLVYSDMNIVTESGQLISNTFWTQCHNNYDSVEGLLVQNSVTGAASMFRATLLDDALPFPQRIGDQTYHDKWMALTALVRGSINYIDEPLYSYKQHSSNLLGHNDTRSYLFIPELRRALMWMRSLAPGYAAQPQDRYIDDLMDTILLAKILALRIPNASPQKKSVLSRFLSFESSAAKLFLTGIPRSALIRYRLYRKPSWGIHWLFQSMVNCIKT